MIAASFRHSRLVIPCLTLLTIAAPATVHAAPGQNAGQDDPPVADKNTGHTPQASDDDDMTIDPAEPDYTLVSLPTSLRLPRFKSAFRVTHRFAEPLTGNFGDLASNFFSLDSGAQIGLEYRFGIVRNGEVGIHRTSDRTIEFFGQYGVARQRPAEPLDLSVLVSVDGTNNFRDQYAPALGAIVSHKFSERGALYVEPIWVQHANLQLESLPLSSGAAGNNTFMVGLGGRVRIRPTVTVVAEYSPRLSGFSSGVNHGSFAIEKRAGGHMFQLNVSDSSATTMGQIARGGPASKDWFMGFNISRKFY
jgi:uncharacterized beta barrel domain-containing protein DUF5777